MHKINLEPLHEEIYEFVTPNGLNVRILPKKGFSKTSVSLQIAFGSIDVDIKNSTGEYHLPDGIAHFLEHMIFENQDKDVSKSFAQLGASVNAYTTYNRTVYYFSTANEIMQPTTLLLDTVFHPTFEEEQIEKEQKIISSEIQMYQDDLEQALYYDTMRLMYHQHPIRNDIAGTVESINQINAFTLKTAFEVFYHPQNALLVISGDIDVFDIKTQLDAIMTVSEERIHHLISPLVRVEENLPEGRQLVVKKDMMNSLVMIGLKLNIHELNLFDLAIKEMKLLLFFDNFFSKSSEYFKTLQKQKAINNNFDFSVSVEETFSHVLLFAETSHPEKTVSMIKEMLLQIKIEDLDEERFIIQKRKIVGQFVQIFNSTSSASSLISEYALKNTRIDELISSIENFRLADMHSFIDQIQEERIVDVIYHC